MKFKAGDRVHVTRLNHNDVDFYATLVDVGEGIWELTYCSDDGYQYDEIYKNDSINFGKNQSDYYTLATDEEDTEPVEVQHIKRENEIELDNHYIIEVKKGLYVRNAISNYFFKFTKDIKKADVYEYENAALKHAEFVDGCVLNLKRYVEVE